MNKKIFIVTANGNHFWHSINVIEDAFREILSHRSDLTWIKEDEVNQVTPGSLVYLLSDKLIFEDIVGKLKKVSDLTYIIPVYGNMTVELHRWPKLHRILAGEKVIFPCASHRSCKQIELLVNGGIVTKLPYPIHQKHFSEPINKLGNDIQLVYAGRLTPQKNIIPLMKLVLLVQRDRPDLKFHIAGDFHERGYHFHGLQFDLEEFKKDFYKVVEESKGGIIYHGFLSQDELLGLHQKSDYVISMSTYHDEDFGVSVAQGLAQGLVPILSDWGGHPEFLKVIDGITIPVKLDELDVPRFQNNQLYMNLLDLSLVGLEKKIENQKKMKEAFGEKTFLNKLDQILSSTPQIYQGQTELYMKFADCMKKFYPFSKGLESPPVKYLDIYQSYLKD